VVRAHPTVPPFNDFSRRLKFFGSLGQKKEIPSIVVSAWLIFQLKFSF
jgi:hypothetical protein